MADNFDRYRSWLAPVAPVAPADAERVWQRIEPRVQPSRQRWLLLAPALAAAAFLAGYLLTRQSGALMLADGSTLGALVSDVGRKAVALSDGSRIELQEHTRLRTLASTASSFETELTHGRAVFDVVPHGPRVWLVRAGDVQVRVLGTRFSVELDGAWVRVAVERGKVQVTSSRGARILEANESLQLQRSPEPKPGASQQSQAKPAAESGGAAAAAASGEAAADSGGTRAQHSRRARPAGHAPSADRRGQDGAAPSSIEDLLHNADAARAAGQPGKAASALERAVSEHPRDARAGLAAFTLAQLYMEQLAQPRDAARAFERATHLGLPTSLAEEAAARSVEAHVRAGERAQAQRAADAYRHKYPDGARAAAIARWLAELQ